MGVLEDLSEELQTLVERTAPVVVHIVHRRGQGSGVVLAQDGYVLTNAHVVRGAERARAQLPFNGEREARLVGSDPHTDLAVLRVDGEPLPSLALAERDEVAVGRIVLAIGNPLGFERSVSLGVISALDRILPTSEGRPLEGLIQTDAAINPGNSGGPLLTSSGTVAGINTAILPFAQGIGFAIPAHTASWVASVLIRKGEIVRPSLGVSAMGVELAPAEQREHGQPRAVRVISVAGGSPAERAGLREGDLLLKAQGMALASIDDLQRVMVLDESDELSLELIRNGRPERRPVMPERKARAA